MIKQYAAVTERDLAIFMNANGLSLDDVRGPTRNASNQLVILWDDGVPASVDGTIGRAGTSSGDASGGSTNIAEVGAVRTIETNETVGAAATTFTGTLLHFPVIPGTLELTVTGTGQNLSDDGAGNLLDRTSGDARKRGTVDYLTGDIAINFGAAILSGNVRATSYDWSAHPDFTDMPRTVRLLAVSLTGFTPSTAVDVKIFEDEAGTVLRWVGAGTTDGDGQLYLPINVISRTQEVADPTKRGRRWVLITVDTAAGAVSLSWERI